MLEKIKNIIIKNKKIILILISIIVVVEIAEDVFQKEMIIYDVWAYKLVVESLRTEWLTPIIKLITFLGSAPVLIAITILSIIIIKNKKIGLSVAANLVFIAFFNQTLKYIIQRPRPEGYRLVEESGFSFPSGHSMVSTAFYGYFMYLIFKKVKNKYLKWGLSILLSIIIVLIGASRVYLGVHYASDVLAGFFISIAYLGIFVIFAQHFISESKEAKVKKILNKK